jgi:4-amino-4-deoxy-L-arabinose transferase-like glycosyltransferase
MFPVYFLGKRLFDQKTALLSVFFLVIHPYIRRFSADVLKESTYIFFLGAAIWFAWKTIQDEKKYPFLFIPIFSVLAYLVRPDGIEVLFVVFFYILFVKKFSIPGSKRKVLLLLILSSCILLLPYLFYIRGLRGEWTLGKAKSIVEMLGVGAINEGVPFARKILYSFKRLNLEILAIGHPVYMFLVIVGLLKGIFSRLKSGEGFLLSFCLLHYGVLFLLVLNLTEWGGDGTIQADYLSGRHVLPLLFFSIYWAGEGLMAIYEKICKKTESILLSHRLTPRRQSVIIFVVVLVLLSAVILPKTLKPQRYERLPEKWAGMWIKSQSGKGMVIFTTVRRVAYYADGTYEYIDLNKENFGQIKSSMAEKKAHYVAIRENEVANSPKLAEAIKRDFVKLARFGGKGMEEIIVYKSGR